MMKAITWRKYGSPDVLLLEEVAKPKPTDEQVLIKIFATAVNAADFRLRKPDPWAVRLIFGLIKPKINVLGGVFSGEVEAIGKDVTKFKVGDKIFGSTGMGMGAYAEYKCLPQDGILAMKPDNLTHNEAATIPFGGLTALDFLRKAKVRAGQKILIYGASGSVGTAAVQLGKYFGAEVTGVCSTTNVNMVKSLGADRVIDYTKENLAENSDTYDVVFITVDKLPFSTTIKSLTSDGTLILGDAGVGKILRGVWASLTSKRKVVAGVIKESAEGLNFLKGLIESGALKPVIDRSYRLSEMADAHRYAEQGHKKGNVAITVVP